ncbi:LysR family transcriptional regulator [Nonomuraea endophytica]|uniref:LysR family transcriptional regulator n=1 Tax=Nonomuraea endophytica TaxID=714136 RepID=UPI0037C68853
MDLQLLRYFVVVAEEGNVGRAARRLAISQPPLSQRIRELERALGCALFVRTPRGMTLTPPGEVLLTEARGLLGAAHTVSDRVRRAAGEVTLRVGVLCRAEDALSASIAEAFEQRHPSVAVGLTSGGFDDPVVGLARDEVDVAITFTPFDQRALVTHTIREERCFAALPTSDPLAARTSVACAELLNRPSIRLSQEADPRWRAYWQPSGQCTGREVKTLDEGLHTVIWQRAVAYVPEQVVRGSPVPGITYVRLSDKPPARLVLVSRKSDRSPLVAGYIAAFLDSRTAFSPPGIHRTTAAGT